MDPYPQLLALPIILPLVATGLLLSMRQTSEKVRHAVNILSCLLQLVVAWLLLSRVSNAGIQVLNSGSWPAPLGITLVADTLSSVMVLITAFVGLACAVYAAGYGTSKFRGYFTPLYQALLLGVNGSFITGDLFNLYVWFEVMLMSSFVLVAIPGGRPQLEAAVKYLTLNFIASAFFLIGLGLLYGLTGTLNMADLSSKISLAQDHGIVLSSAILFLVAFGIKAGVFPFYFWLPSSYHVTPTPIAALFAGLLTKVGVYACLRVFSLVYVEQQELLSPVLLGIGVLTMVTGVFGAASQFFIPRILSFHIISQICYIIIGIGLFTPAALTATIFYIVHHILVKSNLFLIGGIIGRRTGTQQLTKTGGLYRSMPWLACLFLIPAMSLGGIPPLSGFFAKFFLVKEGIALGYGWIIAAALAVGLLTLYSMIKIWNEAFWKDSPLGDRCPSRKLPRMMLLPCVVMAALTVAMGLFPAVFLEMAERAAMELSTPSIYIDAVLGS
ncbi:MAG: proton-conducting transporter membrane subunit, partial [Luteolibacter sp.]